MANQFLNLPTPSQNGVGTAVDVSSMGLSKSIVVAGDLAAVIQVEINNDSLQAGTWAPVGVAFTKKGQQTFDCACRFMRTRVSGFNAKIGGTPEVDVGGTDDGTGFAQIIAPAVDGPGAAVDISALAFAKTIQVGNAFSGTLLLEASEDGVSNWATIASFTAPGQQQINFIAHHLRAKRNGVVAGGLLPIINIGAANETGGGGGGGGGNPQRFVYTANGTEGSDFNVNLPAARVSDLYNVVAQLQGVTNMFGIDLPDILAGDRTTTQFRVVTTSPVINGDRIYFEASDPT